MRTLLAAATAFAALALPAAASAKDFCVGAPAGCSGTPVAAADLKSALTGAQSNGTDDRFILAPGTYKADTFAHKSTERVQIIGAGAGKTILQGSLADDAVLSLEGNPASSVSSLTVEATGGMLAGLQLEGAHARRVAVGVDGTGFSGYGAALVSGASFDDGRVDLGSNDGYGVLIAYAGTVSGSTLRAPGGVGLIAAGGTATVRRSTLSAALGATADSSRLTIADSVINGAQVGAAADPSAVGSTPTVDLERVTIVGGQLGVYAQADDGESAAVHVHDTVISGVGTPVARMASNGATGATVTTDRSVYPAAAVPVNVGPGKLVETHHLSVDPRFADEAGGDFHLAASSPLIDAGTPGSLPAGALDRDGRPRASDGNGDCKRIGDIGAYEYQGTKVKAIAHAAATVEAGKPVAYSAAGSCIPGPEAPTIRWRFDDGGIAAGASVAHTFTTPGRHTATLTVSDAHGHSAQAGTAVVVTAPAVPPRISRLRVSHGRVSFRLSENAAVTVRIAKLGKQPRIKQKITGHQGTNKVRLRKTLKPGRYRLIATATDTTGLHSNRATVRFIASH